MKYDSHPETAKLKPKTQPMFVGDSFSILNYDTDFMELVKSDKVEIHLADFDHLTPGKAHLSDGTVFESDVMLASTGWKHVPPMKFLPEGIEKELGLPHELSEKAPPEDLANQQSLLAQADGESAIWLLNAFSHAYFWCRTLDPDLTYLPWTIKLRNSQRIRGIESHKQRADLPFQLGLCLQHLQNLVFRIKQRHLTELALAPFLYARQTAPHQSLL